MIIVECEIFFNYKKHKVYLSFIDHSYADVNNTTEEGVVSGVKWLLYVCIGLGILSLVVMVMLISFLCINQCECCD